jgi:hypothetical protein
MGLNFPSGAVARRPAQHRRIPTPRFTAPQAKPNTTGYETGVPPRQEVVFKDGSCIWLLRVERHGAPDRFLRELGLPAGGVLVDLRKLVPELAADLPAAYARDVPGIVHHSLRLCFTGKDALIEAAVRSWRT